jgi:formylglycine-generating enzyme required for sulfatase activity
MPTGPAVCNYTTLGQTPQPESCNNLDDDCDGIVDEDNPVGSLIGRNWINIGGGHKMMEYEASRPDASSSTAGTVSTTACSQVTLKASPGGATESGTTATFTTTAAHGLAVGEVVSVTGVAVTGYNGTWQVVTVPSGTTFTATLFTTGLAASGGGSIAQNCVATCSKVNALPWTNVTYLQALAACESIGETLCSESEWHRACSTVTPSTYPLAATGAGLLIEAEDYSGIGYATDTGGTTRAWVEDETPGFFGISDMQAQPVTGGNITAANAATQSPHLDYSLTFTAGNNYHVCVHMFGDSGATNSVWVKVNGAISATALANSTTDTWQWISSAAFVIAAGTQTVSLYMNKDGTKVDALYVINGACPTPTDNNGVGGQWAYATNASNYQPNTCDDHDYNNNLGQADQTVPTGQLASCYANDTNITGNSADHAFDMSGNVKEWATAHLPGQNPLRGGSSTSTGIGTDCPLDFTLGDNTFFFPDVGFRCCK